MRLVGADGQQIGVVDTREALRQAGRQDLIGSGCDCLIPASPPCEALEARRKDANKRFQGEYVHTIPGDANAPEIASGAKKKKGKRKQSRRAPGNRYRPD